MSAGPAIRAFLSLISGKYKLLFKDWQVALRKDEETGTSQCREMHAKGTQIPNGPVALTDDISRWEGRPC
jgi:hypothetical protein